MNIQRLSIDQTLENYDPEMIYDAKNGCFRLILSNIEALEDCDVKIEKIKIWINEDEEAIYEGSDQPWKIAICDNCDGVGSHLKTSLRDIAFSTYDDDYDPDFIDDMMRGRYDQTCEICKGEGRIITLSSIADKKITDDIQLSIEADREYRAEVEMERRMGC